MKTGITSEGADDMKRELSQCRAGDCPSLDGGPVSTSHEGRLSAAMVRRPDAAAVSGTVKTDDTQSKLENSEVKSI
jgi:hypothetical protein